MTGKRKVSGAPNGAGPETFEDWVKTAGYDILRALAKGFARQEADVEDVVQDTLVRMLARYGEKRLPPKVWSALARETFKSVVVDRCRQHGRRPPAALGLLDHLLPKIFEVGVSEVFEAVRHAMGVAGLTDLERRVFEDWLAAGWPTNEPGSAREAANRLGITTASRNQSLLRARRKVARVLWELFCD